MRTDSRPLQAVAVLFCAVGSSLGVLTGCGEPPAPGPAGPEAEPALFKLDKATPVEPEAEPAQAPASVSPEHVEPGAAPAPAGPEVEEPAGQDERSAAAIAAEFFENASARERKGDTAGAIADYTKALELKPDLVEALYYRAGLYFRSDKPEAAIAGLTKAIELEPDYAMAYVGRGYIHQLEGRRGEARSDYVKAATLDPGGTAGELARKNLKSLGKD